MKIILNGNETDIADSSTITSLLEQLSLHGKPVVAEKNEIAILPRAFSETHLEAGDRIEIVALAAGG